MTVCCRYSTCMFLEKAVKGKPHLPAHRTVLELCSSLGGPDHISHRHCWPCVNDSRKESLQGQLCTGPLSYPGNRHLLCLLLHARSRHKGCIALKGSEQTDPQRCCASSRSCLPNRLPWDHAHTGPPRDPFPPPESLTRSV